MYRKKNVCTGELDSWVASIQYKEIVDLLAILQQSSVTYPEIFWGDRFQGGGCDGPLYAPKNTKKQLTYCFYNFRQLFLFTEDDTVQKFILKQCFILTNSEVKIYLETVNGRKI